MKPKTTDTLRAKIDASRDHARVPLWEPPPGTTVQARIAIAIPIEAELIALLLRPIEPGISHRDFHDRKEREIKALIDRLTPVEAIELQRRLANNRPDDALARALTRLAPDRRNRIVAFVADTRRRLALRAAS